MDPTKLLEADHRSVEDLFDRIKDAEGAERTPLIDELRTSLLAHMQLEEQLLYPAMAPITGDEAVEEGNTEHDLARKALDDVVELGPDEPGFGAALEALEAGISHHVEEEENEVFPQLREDGDVLAELAEPMVSRRAELGLPNDADTLATAATRDELLAEARDAGVGGASSMTKGELAEEVAGSLPG